MSVVEKEAMGIHVGQDPLYPYVRISIFGKDGIEYSASLDERGILNLICLLQQEVKRLKEEKD